MTTVVKNFNLRWSFNWKTQQVALYHTPMLQEPVEIQGLSRNNRSSILR